VSLLLALLATESRTGTASITLSDATVSSTGTVALSGAASITLDGVGLSATGQVGAPIIGTASITLASIGLTASGQVAVKADAAITLGSLSLTASGTAAVAGSLSQTLAALTSSSAGKVLVTGSASVTLGAASLTSSGKVAVDGDAVITLGSVSLASSGAVAVDGDASITLGALSLSSTAAIVQSAYAFVRLIDRVEEPYLDRLAQARAIDRLAVAGSSGGAMPAIKMFAQNEGEVINYQLDWTVALNGASISSSNWSSSPAGLTTSASLASPLVTITVSGGTSPTVYQLTNTVITSASETLVRSINIQFEEP
jgi:formylmethanofuran dehydrogenase subunit C